ncbi:MAG TPA: V-type ATP synthase subunit K, partial [Clostridia bacterium]|nr:V-type ATP synthase subunit K [Clostridia bacterium]
EDSSKFVPVMILEALPSTQGIYGFVVAFLIIGKVGGLSLEQGFSLIIAGLPAGVVGLISAIFQGQVAVASIGIVAKRSADMVKGVVLTLMVELFAIFALLISILMVGKV